MRTIQVVDPASGTAISSVSEATKVEGARAVERAHDAFASWSERPVVERCRFLFRYADALERRFEDLARSVSSENGKTIADARAEVRRGIEAVEFACGMPSLMMGDALPDVARAIDSVSMRYPLGVCVGITPFNFPAMIPLWMFPIALAAGNTFVLKPSPQTPLTGDLLVTIARDLLPADVVHVVHGGAETVETLIDHDAVRAVSFVGSSHVARIVQERAVRRHKRVQALGGAKNAIVVMPDSSRESTIDAILSSAFGGAGQRCLAGSIVVPVGTAAEWLVPQLVSAASALRLGPGLEPESEMGPVISRDAKARIAGYVERALASGAKQLLDGRSVSLDRGTFVGPTIIDEVDPRSELATEEVFGPVLAIVRAPDLDAALALANGSRYGNASSIFTNDGGAARTFARRIEVGMVGVNIGVAAPMAFFPFGGVKDSIFGDLRCHGKDAVAFYTQQRVVITRWP